MNSSESIRGLDALTMTALAIAIISWLALFLRTADDSISAGGDDAYYLYYCGAELVDPALRDEQSSLVHALVTGNASDTVVYRAFLRARYCNNYMLSAVSIYEAGKILSSLGITSASRDLPRYMAYAIYFGLMIHAAIIGLVSLLVIFAARHQPLVVTISAALLLAAGLHLLLPEQRLGWILYQGTPSPPAPAVTFPFFEARSFYWLLKPGGAFSIFSHTPRSTVALISLTAFALRWMGRFGLAYWIPVLVSFLHQSTAAILLALLIGCDLVARPRVLSRLPVVVPLIAVVALFISRERLTEGLGLSAPMLLAAAAGGIALAVMIVAFLAWKPSRDQVQRFVSRIQQPFGSISPPLSDAVLLAAAWLAMLPMIYALARNDASYRVIYFWSELPHRIAGLIQVPLLVGLMLPWWERLAQRMTSAPAQRSPKALVCVFGVLIIAAALITTHWKGPETRVTQARAVYSRLSQADFSKSPPTFSDEVIVYMALVEGAITGRPGVSRLFSTPK